MRKVATPLLTALACLSILAPARAPTAQAPTPQTPTAQMPGRIENIPIKSATLTGDEFLRGGVRAREALLAGELRLPLGAAGKVPAVVLVHGSGGISGSLDLWARDLNAAGLAVFILDSFSGRGIISTVADQTQLHSLAMMVDAYRALEVLARHPRIQADRIAVVGYSKGAVAAVYSAVERFRRAYGGPGHRFAAHVGLYTPCNTAFRDDAKVSPAPIRLFHGMADDYVAAGPCREYVARLKEAGADAALTEYAGAHHGFDSPLIAPLVPVPNAQTTRNCRLAEDAAGAIRNASTGAVFSTEDPCVEKGAHVGHHAEAAAAVRTAVKEFLAATLLR